MSKNTTVQYWLFQVGSKQIPLAEALRNGTLESFPVKQHIQKIKTGDKVILWQTGKDAGCYGLAEVITPVVGIKEEENAAYRVGLKVEYNLWSNPIKLELIRNKKVFKNFYAGLSGTNYQATPKQYKAFEDQAKALDAVHEPIVEYLPIDRYKHPLNLILYGPPGTGKTYQTINHALAIIEGRSVQELALEDRKHLRQRFEEYLDTGQIAFTTFHPSFAYEDFIEGIKPIMEGKTLNYAIQDGLFKLICHDARRCLIQALLANQAEPLQIEFDKLYSAFLGYLKGESFNFFVTEDKKRIFLQKVLRFGNLSVRSAKSFAVHTIWKNDLKKIYQSFNDEHINQDGQGVRLLMRKKQPFIHEAIFRELKAFEGAYLKHLEEVKLETELTEETVEQVEIPVITESVMANCRKYVLIIDEINRGNIASTFGELISLIESDKRAGKAEALTAVLPYSKSYFSVPPNLYIIGTMNTSDRSAEALDLALRRRFSFREVHSNPALISSLAKKPIAAGVNLEKMLQAINQRIELLLGRDYCIGHAYFLNIETLDDIKQVFSQKVIPLLQEYFFNDYGKIGLVLGKEFIEDVQMNQPWEEVFADFEHLYSGAYQERKVYRLKALQHLTEGAFIRIYDKSYQ